MNERMIKERTKERKIERKKKERRKEGKQARKVRNTKDQLIRSRSCLNPR